MIKSISSIPIYVDHDNFLDPKDVERLKSLEYHFLPEIGNSFTTNLSILDDFPNIKDLFLEKIKIFEDTVIGGIHPAELYITQSWISDTSKEGYHASHNHANSLFSSVLYISVPDDACINFHHKNRLFDTFNFSMPFQKNTDYNSTLTTLPVKDGDFIIFPSWLNHSVDVNTSDKHRIVLAANFFIKGIIGFDRYPVKIELK